MAKQDEAQAVAAVIDRLAMKFPDTPRPQIEEVVSEEYTALNDGPIRDYVPVLIERAAKLRLRSLPPRVPQAAHSHSCLTHPEEVP